MNLTELMNPTEAYMSDLLQKISKEDKHWCLFWHNFKNLNKVLFAFEVYKTNKLEHNSWNW